MLGLVLLALLACKRTGGEGGQPSPESAARATAAAPETPTAWTREPTPSTTPAITNDSITSPAGEQVYAPELRFALDAVRLLARSKWDGRRKTPWPLTIDQFDPAAIAEYVKKDGERTKALTIPTELEPLYISPTAASEIRELVLRAYDTYVGYLRAKRVHAQYLDAFTGHCLPRSPERIQYHPKNDPDAPPTATQGDRDASGNVADYSALELEFYPVDVYNHADTFKKSGIFGSLQGAELDRAARDFGVRYLTYHELTHVLQRTVETVRAPEAHKKDKIGWLRADKTLTDVDTRYHWKWGSEVVSTSRNREISHESQAEGIAFELTANEYQLSDAQRQAAWEHQFERLRTARAIYDELMTTLDTKFPEFWADEIGSKLDQDVVSQLGILDERRRALSRMCARLGGIGPYGGYLHPMRPEHTHAVWDFLAVP